MIDFLSGASFVAAAAVALFFVRFWRQSGDRFFGVFALAFAVFAVNRLVLTVLDSDDESRDWVYVARLAAFLLILAAIVDKNRPRRQSSAARNDAT